MEIAARLLQFEPACDANEKIVSIQDQNEKSAYHYDKRIFLFSGFNEIHRTIPNKKRVQ